MSRFIPQHDPDPILEAANYWKSRALVSGGSVFSELHVWSDENVKGLKWYFVENPDEGDGKFLEKLERQLQAAGPGVKQLAAEMTWFMLLCPSNISVGNKRDQIRQMWAWSGEELADSEWVRDAVLAGIGSAGTAFNTERWRELVFFVQMVEAFRALSESERQTLLADGWACAEWLEKLPGGMSRQLRHMFLFLLFPTQFERIFGRSDRRKIVKAFTGLRTAAVNAMTPIQIDRELARIRAETEKTAGTSNLDFYMSPLRERWKSEEPDSDEDESVESKFRKNVVAEETVSYTVAEAANGLFLEEAEIDKILRLLRRKKNVVLQGPPGVGKTFVCKRLAYGLIGEAAPDRVQMVQFHQAYSYEDFIQGYRPSGTGFRLKNGLFHEFCQRARLDPQSRYVFMIDEINRGNLSKVFGEVMMLIESDKRKPEWAMPLAYSDSGSDKFYVPENLYLIGMMNTADRSLALVDYALRRRFAFVDLAPKFDSDLFWNHLESHGVNAELIDRIVDKMSELNERIAADTANLGPGFRIGHSYFCEFPKEGKSDRSWYLQVIEAEIAPLLREYYFDKPADVSNTIEALTTFD